jgi:hypothetical protein
MTLQAFSIKIAGFNSTDSIAPSSYATIQSSRHRKRINSGRPGQDSSIEPDKKSRKTTQNTLTISSAVCNKTFRTMRITPDLFLLAGLFSNDDFFLIVDPLSQKIVNEQA